MEKRQMYFPSDLKVRSSENEEKIIEGYFVVFNQVTNLFGNVYEQVERSAVEDSFIKNDIRCLFNHDPNIVLGRTTNGTAKFNVDDYGVYGEIKINPNDQQANDIYARIQRGDVSGCSYSYEPLKEDKERMDNGGIKYILREANVLEVSPVTFPAYPTTQIQARERDVENMQKEYLEKRRKELKEKFRKEQ